MNDYFGVIPWHEWAELKRNKPKKAILKSKRYSNQSILTKFRGRYRVDGGVLNNYPIDFFDNNPNYPGNRTLGLKLVSTTDIKESKGTMGPINNIKDFTQRLLDTTDNQALRVRKQTSINSYSKAGFTRRGS